MNESGDVVWAGVGCDGCDGCDISALASIAVGASFVLFDGTRLLDKGVALLILWPVKVHDLECTMHNRHGGAVPIWHALFLDRQKSQALCRLLMYFRGPFARGCEGRVPEGDDMLS